MNIHTGSELGRDSKAVLKNKFRYDSFNLYWIKVPVGTLGEKNRSLAPPCMSYKAIKWGNMFAWFATRVVVGGEGDPGC